MCFGDAAVGQEAERSYHVVFTTGDEPVDTGVFRSHELQSDPRGNTGKYGGPSRGGAPGGWCGMSGYRRR